MAELPQILLDLGLLSDCCPNRPAIAHVVDECGQTAGGKMNLDEVIAFTGRVIETARTIARMREHQVAKAAGLTIDQEIELRISFGELTRSGVIGLHEVRLVMEELLND